ncbi:MAG: GIY-YIG nuclease family protein [Candidatus Kerfeldbacteria bacterium]|nr:GIY-YIG nuclease family protein [Candidatus Kerfeldbacteria bacterium]
MIRKNYFVYILTNSTHKVLYVGVTNNLERRLWEHKNSEADSFTKRYYVKTLVYFEAAEDISAAIAREKQIKGGSRQKKIDLIESTNPKWRDLSVDF